MARFGLALSRIALFHSAQKLEDRFAVSQPGFFAHEHAHHGAAGVDCDGGGVQLSHGADGKILLDLTEHGYIRMTDSCGEDEAGGFALEAGKDDKEFLLSPVAGKACKPLAWAN